MTEEKVIGQYPNGTDMMGKEFDWNQSQKGLVLSSFFYGYITTQFIGGFVASKIGGTLIFGAGIGMTAILTLLTPIAAKLGIGWLVAIRVVEGVFEGVRNIFRLIKFKILKNICR